MHVWLKPPTFVLLSADNKVPSKKLPTCFRSGTEERDSQLSIGCLMQMGERVEVPVPSLSCLRLDTATPVDKALSFLQGMLKVSKWHAPPGVVVQRDRPAESLLHNSDWCCALTRKHSPLSAWQTTVN